MSDRHGQIYELLMQGLCNKEIARHVGLAEGSVKYHLSRIYLKMGVTTRAAAITKHFRRQHEPVSEVDVGSSASSGQA
jgi:DNA-binding NarL/FixJ family response regulator